MKKFKKLIPALCMLLVSAILLGGSTYAWFSMNNEVTAKGMNVNLKTNTQFLVISKTTTLGNAAETDLQKVAGYGMETGATTVYPVAYSNEGTTLKVTNDGKTVTDKIIQAKGWYTANSPQYNVATGTIGTETEVVTNVKELSESAVLTANNSLAKYTVKYTGYIGLAENSDAVTGTFTVTPSFKNGATLADAAVSALVIIKKGATEARLVFKSGDTAKTTTGTTFSLTSETDGYAEITVYLFVDGNSTNVKDGTDVATLTGNLELVFKMDGIVIQA